MYFMYTYMYMYMYMRCLRKIIHIVPVFSGLVVVPGAAGGQILGGLIPKWLKLRMRGLLLQCLVCGVLSIFLSGQFLLRCSTPDIAGVTVDYWNG